MLLNFLLALSAAALLVLSFPCSTPEVPVHLPFVSAKQASAFAPGQGLPPTLSPAQGQPPAPAGVAAGQATTAPTVRATGLRKVAKPLSIPAFPAPGQYAQFSNLAFFALLPLLLLAKRCTPRAAFGWGYFAGTLWLCLHLDFIGSFGVVPVILLSAFFALPTGLFTYLAHWIIASRHAAWIGWGLPALWTALEYLRSYGFWAFPWNLLGYSQTHDLPLLQIAEVGGVFAVSYAVALGGTALFLLCCPIEGRPRGRQLNLTYRDEPGQTIVEQVGDPAHALARRRRLGHGLCGLGVLLLLHAYGAVRLLQLDNAKPPQALKVGLVQGGMETKESWSTPGVYERSLQAYAEPSRTALSVWQAQHPANAVWQPAAAMAPPPAPPPTHFSLPAEKPVLSPTLPASTNVGPERPGKSTLQPAPTDVGPTRPGSAAPVVGLTGVQPRLTPPSAANPAPASPPTGSAIPPAAGGVLSPVQPPVATTPGKNQVAPAKPAPPPAPPVVPPSDTAHPAYLLVWPEACIPRLVSPPVGASVPGEVEGVVQNRPGCGLLYGAAGNAHDMQRYENGAILLDGHGAAQWVYSKVRLVTYGEVVPFRGLVRFLKYPWGDEDISEGRDVHPFTYAGHKLATIVCFDNLFGFMTRREAQEGAEGLLLVTNNSWYNLPSGIRQHCDMDVLRAVETRRSLGRAATTGWSQLVLPSGRIADTSKLHVQALVEQWMPLSKTPSVYTIVGDVFSQLCLLAAVLLSLRVLLPGKSEGFL